MTFMKYYQRMNESWLPTLTTTNGTLHERLLHALRQDIAVGTLQPEGKLPPHRELASRLGIGVGTVTKAYAEAERLGLLTSAVGRGTFVARTAPPPRESTASSPSFHGDPDAIIDLSLNMQSLDAASARIGDALVRVHDRPDIGDHVTFAPHAGIDWHRQTLAGWLRKAAQFTTVDWRRLIVTTGTQHAMSLSVDELCQPGDVVLTEAATFNGFRAIADYRRLRCAGVAMDRDGILPAALEEAIVTHGSRILYVQPTLQNPTTRTMPRARREEIVAIARRHDLTLIEDDVYAPIAFAQASQGSQGSDLVPLAMLAPERTFYVSSVSKALAPGLRVGMLVAPDRERFDRLGVAMRATCYSTSTLGPLVVSQWIKDGVADEIRGVLAQEASTRMILARRMLGDAIEAPSFPTSLHAWLPMSELRAERVANSVLRRGVMLTPPSSFIVNGESVSGLRLCLNSVTRPEMEHALRIVRSVLADEIVPGRMSIV